MNGSNRILLSLMIVLTTLLLGSKNSFYSQQENIKRDIQDSLINISNPDSVKKDTSRGDGYNKISLNPFLNRALLDAKLLYWNYYSYSESLESKLFFPDEQDYSYRPSLYSLPDYLNSKNEFRKSMRQMLSFKSGTDLGVVGKILGYTGFAAAVGLAIIHVNKYKDFDQEKDKRKKK